MRYTLLCKPEIRYSKAKFSDLIFHENVQCIILASMLILRVAGRLKTGSAENMAAIKHASFRF